MTLLLVTNDMPSTPHSLFQDVPVQTEREIICCYFWPYRPEFSDLDYADVDYRSYGPINYKKASIDVLEQQNRAPSVDNQQRPTRPPKNPSPDLL
uniref:(California timema) hypothetical protein n=1 Tax=Timema californicum TaxID=61474 RepID=A0A7R9P3K1_TIMCA|nr:unnamed protein product [Timema californicum]